MVKMPESQEEAREPESSPENLTPRPLGRMIGAEDVRRNQKTSTPSFGTFLATFGVLMGPHSV